MPWEVCRGILLGKPGVSLGRRLASQSAVLAPSGKQAALLGTTPHTKAHWLFSGTNSSCSPLMLTARTGSRLLPSVSACQ